MSWDLSYFHFMRPVFLLAVPALALLWWALSSVLKPTHWEQHISQHLLDALRISGGKQSNRVRWWLLASWTVACVAIAGPAWQKLPVPTVQNQNSLVIVFDLSRSMLAKDLSPNRLSQARYKLIDILRARKDGQTALIAYAGDAHTVSPLTDDPTSIEVLLDALHPNIMPSQGSNTEAAIALASQLLKDAGSFSGDILLITDGVAAEAQTIINNTLPATHRLSILGLGSTNPTPIPLNGGGFLRNANNEIVLSELNQTELKKLAQANSGRYSQWQLNDSDVQYLVETDVSLSDSLNSPLNNSTSNTLYDSWVDMGYWLVLILIPIVALSFRKGLMYLLPLMIIPSFLTPNNAHAFGWNDLWQTKDQQAAKLLESKEAQQAADTFQSKDWQAAANYQAGNYADAATQFEGNDANNHYNLGNALALQGDLEGALKAYESTLETSPDHEDAKFNKGIIEQLLKQQEKNQGDSQKDSSEQESSEQEKSEDGEKTESSEQSDRSEQDSKQESDQGSEQKPNQESEESSQNNEGESGDKDGNEAPEDNADKSEKQDGAEPDSEQESEQSTTSQGQQQSEQEQEQKAETATSQQSTDEEQGDSPEEERKEAQMLNAEQTPEQLKDSSEQWLRRIQDDPSGLLRRKFEYQARQRAQQNRQAKQANRSNNNQPESQTGNQRY